MGLTAKTLVRQGGRYVLAVPPLEWYAGSVGVGAIVQEASESAVYVLFDGGLRESYPPARFVEYFRPEEYFEPRDGVVEPVPVPISSGTNSARTASGRILRH
jgi:hypothetical protein